MHCSGIHHKGNFKRFQKIQTFEKSFVEVWHSIQNLSSDLRKNSCHSLDVYHHIPCCIILSSTHVAKQLALQLARSLNNCDFKTHVAQLDSVHRRLVRNLAWLHSGSRSIGWNGYWTSISVSSIVGYLPEASHKVLQVYNLDFLATKGTQDDYVKIIIS